MKVDGTYIGLVADFKGDNAGPQSAEEVLADLATMRKNFPNAQIIASTFENFIQDIEQYRPLMRLITAEIGDTWIHGSS
jgi:hypothetical protein